MEYVDTKNKVVLYMPKKKGDGQLERDTTFMDGSRKRVYKKYIRV